MKKIIAALLVVLMLIPMSVSVFGAYDFNLRQKFLNDQTFILGDVNDDGLVNSVDSYFLRLELAGVNDAGLVEDAADFDADSRLTAVDSYSLKLCLAGMKTTVDFESGHQLYKLTVGGNDVSDYCIVLNEGITDDENSYFAALNLQKYLKKVTGADLPIVYGEATTEKAFYLMEYTTDTERGSQLGIEGYKYWVEDGNLYVEGTYRGTMYAVYEILEDYLGVRFYSNKETFVYKQRSVDIPEGTVCEYTPKLVFRHACQTYGSDGAFEHYFPNKLNGTQLYAYAGKRYGTLSGPIYSNAHSFYEYWKMANGTADPTGLSEQKYLEAKFAAGTAPDPYKWQPCATSSTVFDKLFQGMLDCNKMSMYWGNPLHYEEEISVMSFSILDNQYYCTCRNCSNISNGKRDNPKTEEDESTPAEGYAGLYLQMYNKAVIKVQDYYPGLRLYGIVYAKDFPVTIKPHDNLVILYCGISCENHIIGMEECCEEGGQLNGMKNDSDVIALNYWGNLCKETGAELWFWIYPVNYHYYLTGCPNIPNLYYTVKYLVDNCNVNGIYYEGGGESYNFESLKAYATVQLMWDTDMTYEEYTDVIKEYLYIRYGDGVEELYQYILMQTEAGDRCDTCCINNYDRPGDMYSYEYIAENYEEMRGLLLAAYDKALNDDQRDKINTLIACCDFLALSAVHQDWYVEGNNVELYRERYYDMFCYMRDTEMVIFSSDLYILPEDIRFDLNPMYQFYSYGSRREGVEPFDWEELDKQMNNETANQTAIIKVLTTSNAWKAAEAYGKTLYGEDFELDNENQKLFDIAVTSDTWYLSAKCYVDGQLKTCEAKVSGTNTAPVVSAFTVIDW